MTERLYYQDAYQKVFEAKVTGCKKTENGYRITLDRTAFYPEGGGQPCDLGVLRVMGQEEASSETTLQTITAVDVCDVQEEGCEVLHFCKEPIAAGMCVQGEIDWSRRLTHMREHAGEHIISGIICNSHGYDNIGFHMGKDSVTIDFNGLLTEEEIWAAEKKANQKVLENVEILAEYPTPEILVSLPYRSKKEIDGPVRIVTVPGADVCACCGTHVKRTGEIGPIKVIGSEHYKSGIRLTILIGEKALADYWQKSENIKKISMLLSAKPEQTAAQTEKLQENYNQLKAELIGLKMTLLEQKVEAIPAGTAQVLLFENGLTPVELRKLADRLQEKTAFAAVFGGSDKEGYKYVICSRTADVSALGKKMNAVLQGRGGGKNPMIQGSLQADKKSIEDFFKAEGLV